MMWRVPGKGCKAHYFPDDNQGKSLCGRHRFQPHFPYPRGTHRRCLKCGDLLLHSGEWHD